MPPLAFSPLAHQVAITGAAEPPYCPAFYRHAQPASTCFLPMPVSTVPLPSCSVGWRSLRVHPQLGDWPSAAGKGAPALPGTSGFCALDAARRKARRSLLGLVAAPRRRHVGPCQFASSGSRSSRCRAYGGSPNGRRVSGARAGGASWLRRSMVRSMLGSKSTAEGSAGWSSRYWARFRMAFRLSSIHSPDYHLRR